MPYACPPHLRHLRHLRRVWLVLSLVLLASPAQATTSWQNPFRLWSRQPRSLRSAR